MDWLRRQAMQGLCATAISIMGVTSAIADPVEPFYKGKQVRLVVGSSTGGDYDMGGRILARHLGRHIPGNPTVIVQNMPGSGSIRAANHLYNVAPKDGTVIGSFSRNIPSQAVLGQANLKVDPRQLGWIGASSIPSRICLAWTTSPIKKVDDLFQTEFIVGSTGVGSVYSILPTVMNDVLKTKFKVVEGYQGVADILLAMERGEVGGICHNLSAVQNLQADLLKTGKVRVLFNAEEQPLAELPGVPTIFSYIKGKEELELMRFIFGSTTGFGRPYAFPPGVPAERLEAMRKAFAAALADPLLIEEAKKLNIDMTYRPAKDLEALVRGNYAMPPDLLARAERLIGNAL
jgi:tripartite-type tricarboxylate transporter receptor subunit TctC